MGDSPNPKEVAKQFEGYGGTILRTKLAPWTAASVQHTIGSQAAAIS
jgi:hypothetical protein